MKNERGFTLIELLAVIVVLASIAVITLPDTLGFTDDAKRDAAKSSAISYISAVSKVIAVGTGESINDVVSTPDGCYQMDAIKLFKVSTKGKVPTNGIIIIESNQVAGYSLVIDGSHVVTRKNMSEDVIVSDSTKAKSCSTLAPLLTKYTATSYKSYIQGMES